MSSRRKIIATGLCGLVLIGGAAFVWLNGSNEGNISPASSVNPTKSGQVGYKDFEGKYVKFTYLDSYLTQTLKATDNDLELYKLSANTTYEKTLVVAVSTLPQSSLDQNSAYLLRKTQTDVYRETKIPFNGGVASVWTRSNNQEISAFLQQGSRVAVLSFVQGATLDSDLPQEVEAVIKSFAWK